MGGLGERERFLGGSLALVTGAGSGLGAATALRLAEHGADVLLVGRRQERLEQVAAEIDGCGSNATVAACDVTDLEAIRALFDEHVPRIVVNSAGTNVPQPAVEVEEDTFDQVFELNVKATFFVSQAAARALLAVGQPGSIVNVSSQMGQVGAPNRSVYCATKHAVEGFTKAMALELAPAEIRVNSVAPTFIRTPMTESFLADEKFRHDVISQIPIGRMGTTAEVAAAIAFLASPEASLITGSTLAVDGGWTAR